MLAYGMEYHGAPIITPHLSPSTTAWSACGHVKTGISLGERAFGCGAEVDRDLNAARNLAAVAGSSPETQNACGGGGSGREHGPVKPTPEKQEPLSRKRAAAVAGNKRL